MNSFSEFPSSPLLDFVLSDSNKQPNELDMLLETLSESDIQILYSRVRGQQTPARPYDITNGSVANVSGYLLSYHVLQKYQ